MGYLVQSSTDTESSNRLLNPDMPKIILACDLDNTLIHSYKHYVCGDICIEHINGNEQGYMHRKTFESFQRLPQNVFLIPVTSRSVEQYNRIKWANAIFPKYALTTNGCILLNNDVIQQNWIVESNRRIAPFNLEYAELQDIISKTDGIERCRMVDNIYLFARFSSSEYAQRAAHYLCLCTNMEVICLNRKLYIFPSIANKGAAIDRLKQLFEPDVLICAGDSKVDVPMLQKADIAIVPNKGLSHYLSPEETLVCNEERYFSDYIFEVVERLCESYRAN